jgi:hypothetical protein
MPVTLIRTLVKVAGPDLLNNMNDEEFGEEIVALFIAHANAERRAAGQPDLGIGSLCNTPAEQSREDLATILEILFRRLPRAA